MCESAVKDGRRGRGRARQGRFGQGEGAGESNDQSACCCAHNVTVMTQHMCPGKKAGKGCGGTKHTGYLSCRQVKSCPAGPDVKALLGHVPSPRTCCNDPSEGRSDFGASMVSSSA